MGAGRGERAWSRPDEAQQGKIWQGFAGGDGSDCALAGGTLVGGWGRECDVTIGGENDTALAAKQSLIVFTCVST